MPIALVAYGMGYMASSARKGSRALQRILKTEWRTVKYGPLVLRTPPTWGDVEQTTDGMLVLHNRPAKARVDGDAVWYGSTIEIRFYREGEDRPVIENAWRSWKRSLGSRDASVVAELIVANGVRATDVKKALAALKSLRLDGSPTSISWPAAIDVSTKLRSVVPPHSSRIARDFERF